MSGTSESTPQHDPQPADAPARAALRAYLAETALEWEEGAREGEFVVTLPGEKKLKTVVSVLVGDTVTSTSAFVIRNADENHERFYRYLLRRNLRLHGLAYAIDLSGDVYVRGQVPTTAVDAAYLDGLFGSVLEAADDPFNELLVIGFLSSMRKEWAWRLSRGESTRNLEAFRRILESDEDPVIPETDPPQTGQDAPQ